MPQGDDESRSGWQYPGMHKDDTGAWHSDDDVWVWNGSAWEPASPAPSEVPTSAPKPDAEHPLSPDGSQVWDGTAWVPTGGAAAGATAGDAPPEPPAEHPLSPDGHWQWDGTAWQPVDAAAPHDAPTKQLSPDGKWVWDGTAWQPVTDAVAASNAPAAGDTAAALIASGMPVSDDGAWVWNGTSWIPTAEPEHPAAKKKRKTAAAGH